MAVIDHREGHPRLADQRAGLVPLRQERVPEVVAETAPSVPRLAETTLTPELAASLLANLHPRQRRTAVNVVADYARQMKAGDWRLIPDPVMVDKEGRLFNGRHRCEAVAASKVSVPVYIEWDADPDTFDLIDNGRKRSAFQFIEEGDPSAVAASARVLMWYARRFDQPLSSRATHWGTHELLQEVNQHDPTTWDWAMSASRKVYRTTSLSRAVVGAILMIAHQMGLTEQAEQFCEYLIDPFTSEATDSARFLSQRMARQENRARRRSLHEEWVMFTMALNMHLNNDHQPRLTMTTVEVWPRVGEPYGSFDKRRIQISDRNSRKRNNKA